MKTSIIDESIRSGSSFSLRPNPPSCKKNNKNKSEKQKNITLKGDIDFDLQPKHRDRDPEIWSHPSWVMVGISMISDTWL